MDDLRFSALREANVLRCETHYHSVSEWSLADWMACVSAEAGELAGVIKNMRRFATERGKNGHLIREAGVKDLAQEAADVVVYLDLLCARAGVDLGAAVREKFNLVSRERLDCDILLVEGPLSSDVEALRDRITQLQFDNATAEQRGRKFMRRLASATCRVMASGASSVMGAMAEDCAGAIDELATE